MKSVLGPHAATTSVAWFEFDTKQTMVEHLITSMPRSFLPETNDVFGGFQKRGKCCWLQFSRRRLMEQLIKDSTWVVGVLEEHDDRCPSTEFMNFHVCDHGQMLLH